MKHGLGEKLVLREDLTEGQSYEVFLGEMMVTEDVVALKDKPITVARVDGLDECYVIETAEGNIGITDEMVDHIATDKLNGKEVL